jgi:rubredoxin
MSYKCKECDLVFYSREGLEVHVIHVHDKPQSKGLDIFR